MIRDTLAARAPAAVFAAIGPGRQADAERLFARRDMRRASTPRDASILLVAGDIPAEASEALARVHDQIPPPRATVQWQGEDADRIAARVTETLKDLRGTGTGEADRLPDEPPNEWKGIGPHGQGGKGMMGGTPYGRPMAMTGPDIRDGLQLDRYTARIGPFAPMLPPGLTLEVTLQGDVICDVSIGSPPFAQPADADAPELCLARVLRLLGLDRAADRVLRGKRPGALWVQGAIPRGLGRIDGTDTRGRVAAWRKGEAAPLGPFDLPQLLTGAEWSEAMLILASLPPSALIRAARAPEAA